MLSTARSRHLAGLIAAAGFLHVRARSASLHVLEECDE
jgi:hypothetical protein